MKKLIYLRFTTAALLMLLVFTMSNCSAGIEFRPVRSSYNAKPLPPGQAKKIYGGKSAKGYAPGHNKN